jgi:hypothetical protein
VVIPAVSIGFVLLIVPLSHAGSPLLMPTVANWQDEAVRAAIGVLRREAGKGTTRVGASSSAASLLEFYRARFRQRNWLTGSPRPEYFLWVSADAPPTDATREVLFQRDGVVLFH